MKDYLTRKLLLAFRDKLIKHLYDMNAESPAEIIEEVYKLLTSLSDTLKD